MRDKEDRAERSRSLENGIERVLISVEDRHPSQNHSQDEVNPSLDCCYCGCCCHAAVQVVVVDEVECWCLEWEWEIEMKTI